MSDPRIPKLIAALLRRFPGTTIITRPIPDPGIHDECCIKVLNAPDGPPGIIHDVANELIDKLWGDDPAPVLVGGVRREDTAKCCAKYLPKARAARRAKPPRAVAATPRRRAAKRRARAAR